MLHYQKKVKEENSLFLFVILWFYLDAKYDKVLQIQGAPLMYSAINLLLYLEYSVGFETYYVSTKAKTNQKDQMIREEVKFLIDTVT